MREYLRTPLGMRLVNLPGYSPDFNADEAIWGGRERRPLACASTRVGKFLSG